MRPATRPDGAPLFDVARAAALYPSIPRELLEGLGRYFNLRIATGSFLRAVLANDLHSALFRADPVAFVTLPQLSKLLFMEAPSFGWGTEAAVRAWLKNGPSDNGIDQRPKAAPIVTESARFSDVEIALEAAAAPAERAE